MGESAAKEKLTKKNQSIDKLFQIIEVLMHAPGPMRLQDIALKTGYPASTVLRMLYSIITIGYALQDPETGKYSLSLKFCQIGEAVRSQFSIVDVAHPYLVTLTDLCKESICLAIEQDRTVVYIDSIEGQDNMLRTLQRIGKRAPMHCTGVGKLMLAEYSSEKLSAFVLEKGLPQLTENTITEESALEKELAQIRMQGYAFDNEECEYGAKCVAAPIKDYSGHIVACLSASGPLGRMQDEALQKIIAHTKQTADDISKRLGYL